ncbi:MAG: sulfite exporter TauE/SafE family protein [Betaproteobacteria bacterium]|nr:sulfite exporter TauE/SafE family protein [Betaproteobacteria bacterium]
MDLLYAQATAEFVGSVAALLAVGAIAGLLAGLLGTGSGLVIAPVLYHLFTLQGIDESVRMHLTVGTSLAASIPVTIVSRWTLTQQGNLDKMLIQQLIPGLIIRVMLSALASHYLGSGWLTGLFACVAISIAANMAFWPAGFALGAGLPGSVGTTLIGGGIGSLATLTGMGGSALSAPIFHALRVPLPTAVSASATLGIVIGIAGTLAFIINGTHVAGLPPWSWGYVNLLAVALIAPASMAAAALGTKLAPSVDARLLRMEFACFLALTALHMTYTLFN